MVRTANGAPRPLTLRGNADVYFTNLASQEQPCGDNDYLIHYLVATRRLVPPADFHAPESCNAILAPFDLETIGYVHSTTLSNCSNSVYP
jgi:hypothetical protein